jgi:hypothetical protein
MTRQAFSPSLFAPAREGRERSFWRQLLGAIMEGRQRKADEYTSGTICAVTGASILTSSTPSSRGGFWVSTQRGRSCSAPHSRA